MSYEPKLILIRHGEAEHLTTNLTGGWTDSSLTEKGIKQAHNTGKKLQKILKGKDIDLFCSDLARARETAEIIGTYLQKEPISKKGLRELNNGLAANITQEEAQKIAIPKSDPILDWIPYPEGESWRMLYRRMKSFFNKLYNDKRKILVIVGHGNALACTIHWWLKISEKQQDKIYYAIDPCSITILGISEYEERMILKLNDTCHLNSENIF